LEQSFIKKENLRMMMQTLGNIVIGVFVLLMLVPFINAESNKDKWCPTITSIYGMCSEQLIDNWLAHRNDNFIRPKMPPKSLVNAIVPQITTPTVTKVKPAEAKIEYRECWYWNNYIYVKCRYVG
jgi:hypothetical protein